MHIIIIIITIVWRERIPFVVHEPALFIWDDKFPPLVSS